MSYRDAFVGMQEALRANPEAADVVFEASSRQVAGLKSEATVRQFSLIADEPQSLGGTDEGPNPVELILAALGTCQEITYRLYADALGIPLNGVSVKVTGDLDLRGFFAVDEAVRPGFGAIRAEVTLDSPATDADLERLKETVDRHCPVLDLLSNPTPVTLALSTTPAAETNAA